MEEKSNVNSELLEEAYNRGVEYLMKYACAPGVFAAVMDTLGYEDDPDVNKAWSASLGLIGGTGNMGVGTCGAMAGAAMAISYSFGMNKNEPMDYMKVLTLAAVVAEVGDKVREKYTHITCQEIQFHLMGKAYRFSNAEAAQEFMNQSMSKPVCDKLTGDIARWTVEAILEHSPQFSRRK